MTQTAMREGSPGGSSTAQAALVVSWGHPVSGREQQAPQVLSEALSYYKRLSDSGAIDGYEPVALEPHGSQMQGFVLLHGKREDLNKIRISDEFLSLCQRASLCINDLDVTLGLAGPDFQKMVQEWRTAAQEVSR